MSCAYSVRAAINNVHGIERLCKPLEDALAAMDSGRRYDESAELMILKSCARTGTVFWSWDASVWRRLLGTTQQVFFAAHVPTPKAGGERHVLIAIAYLLRCCTDIPALGEVQRVGIAEKVFGRERVGTALKRVTDVAMGWGYRHSSALECVVAELFLINQHPELEALSMELIESAKRRRPDCPYRSALYCQLCRVLENLGILAHSTRTHTVVDRALREARLAGTSPEWASMVERWEATSSLTAQTRTHTRDAILKAGRWLQKTHPQITTPQEWTRELAAEYVGAVSRMKVGDYVGRIPVSPVLSASLYQPVPGTPTSMPCERSSRMLRSGTGSPDALIPFDLLRHPGRSKHSSVPRHGPLRTTFGQSSCGLD